MFAQQQQQPQYALFHVPLVAVYVIAITVFAVLDVVHFHANAVLDV
jgi:hypothetical protein